MNLYERFSAALPMDHFLSKYGTAAHRERWKATFDTVQLSPEQKQLLGAFTRKTNVMVLAGAWCGDCSGQCPIFNRFADAAPVLNIRYLDNADHADVQKYLSINGGNRVPVAVFFSEDGYEVSRYGERTLAKYRDMVRSLSRETCPTGIGSDPLMVQITQDWLNEFERVQWLLRLSTRLRKLHGD
jgi:thiol-disulfide isomerase/thioredoxin